MPPARADVSPQRTDRRPSGGRDAAQLSLAGPHSLHARLVARDERALAELIEFATPWVLGVAEGLLSDPTEAEEVAQEVFAIVWNSIGQVRTESPGLIAWVLRIARNRAIDRLRSRRARLRKSTHLAAHTGDDEPFASVTEPNEAATPGWYLHQAVHQAIAGLPREQQVCVRLAYFEGLTRAAIAQRLSLPLGTVKTRLRLAFDKLRLELAPVKDWIV